MGSRAEEPNQLRGDPFGGESVNLGIGFGSGAAGSLQPDPVASLPRLPHGRGGEDAGDLPRGGRVGKGDAGGCGGKQMGSRAGS